jgi:predicted DNA-binding transcriptional regulator YafY
MPYNKDAYTRYKLIDTRLRQKQKPAPTLEDLVAYVCEKLGKSVSTSSIQKDIKAMRSDTALGLNAPIVFDRYKYAYKYSDSNYSIDRLAVSEEDLQGLEMSLGILQQFTDLPAIKMFEDSILRMVSSVKKSRETASTSNNILLLDRPNKYGGVQYMAQLADAIIEHKVTRLSYQPFNKPQPKDHVIHPYFIKEYDGRLYLIANDVAFGKLTKFLTFSFDRITKVLVTNEDFKQEKIDQTAYFRHTLGISNVDDEPQNIILSFAPEQANYIKTQPIHHSQSIISDTNEAFIVQLKLVINQELKMRILSFGSKIKVLEPQELRTYILSEAKQMAKN